MSVDVDAVRKRARMFVQDAESANFELKEIIDALLKEVETLQEKVSDLEQDLNDKARGGG